MHTSPWASQHQKWVKEGVTSLHHQPVFTTNTAFHWTTKSTFQTHICICEATSSTHTLQHVDMATFTARRTNKQILSLHLYTHSASPTTASMSSQHTLGSSITVKHNSVYKEKWRLYHVGLWSVTMDRGHVPHQHQSDCTGHILWATSPFLSPCWTICQSLLP